MRDKEEIIIPDDIFEELENVSEDFASKESVRKESKDVLDDERKKLTEQKKEMKVKTSLSSAQKMRFRNIGQMLFSSGAQIIERIIKKEMLKIAMNKTSNFLLSPIKIASDAISKANKSPVFNLLVKISSVLFLGYFVLKELFESLDKETQDIISKPWMFIKEKIFPVLGNIATGFVDFLADISNIDFSSSLTFTMDGFVDKLSDGVAQLKEKIFKEFSVGAKKEAPSEDFNIDFISSNATLLSGERNGLTEEQNISLTLTREMSTQGNIYHLIDVFNGTDKITEAESIIRANGMETVHFTDPRDKAIHVQQLAQTFKEIYTASAENANERIKLENMNLMEFYEYIHNIQLSYKGLESYNNEYDIFLRTVSKFTQKDGVPKSDRVGEDIKSAFEGIYLSLLKAEKVTKEAEEKEETIASVFMDSVDDSLTELEELVEDDAYNSNDIIRKLFFDQNNHIIEKINSFLSLSYPTHLSFFSKSANENIEEKDVDVVSYTLQENDIEENDTSVSLRIEKKSEIDERTAYKVYENRMQSVLSHVMTIIEKTISLQDMVSQSIKDLK